MVVDELIALRRAFLLFCFGERLAHVGGELEIVRADFAGVQLEHVLHVAEDHGNGRGGGNS